MSSPKAAAKAPAGIATKIAAKAATKAATRAAPKPAAKAAAKPHAKTPARSLASKATKAAPRVMLRAGEAVSADATRIAAEIEQALANGRNDLITPAALQALMAAACKAYAAQVEAGNPMAALGARTSVTPTEVMITASGLLRAANLAVFELGMWQSWTGR
jgi:hypothetical protein